MRIPTEEDINVFNSLDERVAVEHFLGKSAEQAEKLFGENGLLYQEDLMWMGPMAFAFYLQAAANYVCGSQSEGDLSFVDSVIRVIDFRSDEPQIRLAFEPMGRIVAHVVDNFDRFTIDPEVGQQVLARYRGVQKWLSAQINQ